MTILTNLQAAGLPVISATESGEITMGAMSPAQLATYNDVVLSYFNPTEYANILADRASLATIKGEYSAAITRLTQIEAAAAPTNAQVIAAIRDMAKYQRELLQFLRNKIQ